MDFSDTTVFVYDDKVVWRQKEVPFLPNSCYQYIIMISNFICVRPLNDINLS